jgi:hypothetical protein
MSDPARALQWVVDVLGRHGVPFQAVGGLAARAHGATRPLIDLDFYLPLREVWPALLPEVDPHVTWGPEHYRDSRWDITFVKLTYAEQPIEFGDSSDAFFFDPGMQEWVRQTIIYDTSEWREVLGVRVPVMPRSELIEYKRRLNRPVDQQDLLELANAGPLAQHRVAGDEGPSIAAKSENLAWPLAPESEVR